MFRSLFRLSCIATLAVVALMPGAGAQTVDRVVNGSFEADAVPPTWPHYMGASPLTGWTKGGGSHILNDSTGPFYTGNNGPIPNGAKVYGCQGEGSISQAIDGLMNGLSCTLSFRIALRDIAGSSMELTVRMGSQTLWGPARISAFPFATHSVPFTYNSGWGNTLTFEFTNPISDATLLLDQIQLVTPVTYTVNYSATPAGAGTVSGQNWITHSGQTGSTINVTAAAAAGYVLGAISATNGTITGAYPTYALQNVTANTTVNATFIAPDWQFNTNGNFEGWAPQNEIENQTVAGGVLSYDITAGATDPMWGSPVIGMPRANFRWLRVIAQNGTSAPMAVLFYDTNLVPGFDGLYHTPYTINPNDPQYSEYWVDLNQDPEWVASSVAEQFRFDFPDGTSSNGRHVNVDRITLFASGPPAPAVSGITRHAPAVTPPAYTNAAQVVWNVRFNHTMTTVTASDFVVTGTGTASGAIANVAQMGPTWYRVTANVSGSGTVRLDAVANATARDIASQAMPAAFNTGEVFNVDRTAPAVAISAPSPTFATNTVQYTVTYTDAGAGLVTPSLAAGQISFNVTGDVDGEVTSITGSNPFTVTIGNITGNGSLGITVAAGAAVDAVGNASEAATKAGATIDNLAPSFSAIAAAPALARAGTAVTITFTASETGLTDAPTVTVNGNGASFVSLAGSTYTYAYTVTAGDVQGTATIAMSATDYAGNTGAGNSNSALTIDLAAPTFTNIAITPDPVAIGQAVTITFDAPEALAANPAVTVEGRPATYGSFSAGAYSYGYTTAIGTDAVGVTNVAISGSDAAGNTGSGAGSFQIVKATPTVTAWPTGATITYGQTLGDSTLGGGTASVAGLFAWTNPATAPNAGTNMSFPVTFTPNDTANWNTVSGTAPVSVNRAVPTVSTWPTAAAITYGQTLASATLSGGAASVTGTFAYATPAIAPSAGTAAQQVRFTPDNANYETVTGTVDVTVNKATPTFDPLPTPSALTYGQTLGESTLTGATPSTPGTFAWPDPNTVPEVGTSSQQVTFTPADDANYNTVTVLVLLTVNKVTPMVTEWPTAAALVYGQTLMDSALSGGAASVAGSFAWAEPATVPTVGGPGQPVVFMPTDNAHYAEVTGAVSVSVSKALPTIITPPTAAPISVGQPLSASALTGGVASTSGSFEFTAPATILPLGTSLQSVTFTPTDLNNYVTTTLDVTVTINNKTTPTITQLPAASVIAYGQSLFDSTLTGGAASVLGIFEWTTPTLTPDVGTADQTVVFTPDDLANYNPVEVTVPVTVEKATPAVIVDPAASTILQGQPLSMSVLNGGEASVPGTFAWTDPAATPETGTSDQSVTFTPADGERFNTVTFLVPVTVTPVSTLAVTLAPTTVTVSAGESLVLTATATGAAGTVHYSWLKDGQPAPSGADAPTYIVDAVSALDAGVYTVEASDDVRVAVSNPATVIVGTGVPAVGLWGLGMMAAAIAGVAARRRR